MKYPKYTEEVKAAAVKQMLERGYSQVEGAIRLGVAKQALRNWVLQHPGVIDSNAKPPITIDKNAETARLKAENRRLTKERDILKKAAAYMKFFMWPVSHDGPEIACPPCIEYKI